jgi:hypothetical protein
MTRTMFNGEVLDTDIVRTSNVEVTTCYAGSYETRLVVTNSLKTGKITTAKMYLDGALTEFKKGLPFESYLRFFTCNVKVLRNNIR